MCSLCSDDLFNEIGNFSPAFTGSKMRKMFDLVSVVGKQSAETIKEQIDKTGSIFEMKDFLMKFTVDVIATCAFGLEVNSFKNPNNEFQSIAKKSTNFNNTATSLKFVGFTMFPNLMKFFKIKFFDSEVTEFFQTAIVSVMKEREVKGIIRHDMIDLLMDAKKGKLTYKTEEKEVDGFATVEESDLGKSKIDRVWDEDDLSAQAFIFFFAGFETVSATMSFIAYELGVNPDIQQKLINEIDETFDSLNGQDITYDRIQKMKYMDQVVCETLR